MAALARALEYPGDGRIPIGIIYRTESQPSYEEQVPALQRYGGPATQPLLARPQADLNALLQEFI